MEVAQPDDRGLALGAWGAAQATAAGLAIAASGIVNDAASALAMRGALGEALVSSATGYAIVYVIEILLLVATVIVIGPLVRFTANPNGETKEFNLVTSPSFNPGAMR